MKKKPRVKIGQKMSETKHHEEEIKGESRGNESGRMRGKKRIKRTSEIKEGRREAEARLYE